jgi:hypothetical protein
MTSARTSLSLAVVLAALALPASAIAETDTTSVALTGGTLSFTAAPLADDFAGVTLDGTTKTLKTRLNDWKVSDATGTGNGWNVTFGATQFSTGGATPKTLPAGSLKLKEPVVSKTDLLNTATAPVRAGTPPWVLDNGSVKLYSAASGTGQGEFLFDHVNLATDEDLVLTVPPTAAAGTYSSTITFTLATGP